MYTSGLYASNNPTWDREDSAWKATKIVDMLSANGIEPNSVVEVGCGAGEVLTGVANAFKPTVDRCFGYDVSEEAISLARATNVDSRISFVQGDPVGFHDLVLLIDVIEHVPDCFGFVASAGTLGNLVCAHIPLAISALTSLRPTSIMSARESVGHIHLFTAETAAALFTDLGFEIIDRAFTASAVELQSESRRTRIGRIPRKLVGLYDTPLAARLFGGFSLLILAKSPASRAGRKQD